MKLAILSLSLSLSLCVSLSLSLSIQHAPQQYSHSNKTARDVVSGNLQVSGSPHPYTGRGDETAPVAHLHLRHPAFHFPHILHLLPDLYTEFRGAL